jgi:ADP-ribose pyrophosphatase YjhB (NUDIX family)
MSSTHPEVCVGAVVVRDGELLLVRRGRGAGQGMWSIPGGRVELGETLTGAVGRELAEETGVVARETRYLGHVERIGGGWHFVIHDFLVTVDEDAAITAGDDASEVRWEPLRSLGALDGLVPGLVEFLGEHGLLG